MDSLTDYRPLERVSLPGLGDIECSGLILVVGANSSGKSQLLQDLYQRICGEPRHLVVATEIGIRGVEYESFMGYLKTEGYFETVEDESGSQQWRPLKTYVGSGQSVQQIQPRQAQEWHSTDQSHAGNPRRKSEWLNYFGRLLVTGLFLDRRLTGLSQVGMIDFHLTPPQLELHALYLDDDARRRLFDEMLESFGKAVWPDASRGTGVCLRVSDEGVMPTAEDRLSPKTMAAYRQVESEGDGLKSFVSICVALILGRRPVCLIDEPEMCLHPPQAYNLGRFIGKNGTDPKTVTFVSTHSSHILRGVIQSTRSIQIVRMSRREAQFEAHLVPADVLADALTKPTVRADSVLDGIFAQSVIVVEADSDRVVYQTVLETLAPELRLDVHLATVGGTGGIADTCKLYRTLKIPVAVIADLDVISDPVRLRKILDVLAAPADVDALVRLASEVMQMIRVIPPAVSTDSMRANLKTLVDNPDSWSHDSDVATRRELNRIANQLDRLRSLKRGGISVFPSHVAEPLVTLTKRLGHCGLFAVPVGELEEWLSTLGIVEKNKWAWANAASLAIQAQGPQPGDIWDFIRQVGHYLSSR